MYTMYASTRLYPQYVNVVIILKGTLRKSIIWYVYTYTSFLLYPFYSTDVFLSAKLQYLFLFFICNLI